ncbi:MAG: 2-C-methyl-D-erythritol 4-phosphate cytidylyltransferase [Desulfotomaculaceae bacterium]|nr:2-C-methyl-D-erythritol 4-phosphate cytidylyltransferase [Desulfotomaculaceae bacterium]MDD4767523.1 2-C-methyl-D-erythritol 4-phosphate cytidylyltransferase [Desulfotomaculaceae bacterium]
MAKIAAIVPAAGSGTRMGMNTKKQFLALAGTPLVGYALKAMETSPAVQEIVIVVSPGEEGYCRSAVVDKLGLNKIAAIVPGGKERQDSVYNGLLALSPDTDIVIVHDGVRPCFSLDTLAAVIAAAQTHGAATCAVPAKDTVKLANEDNFVTRTLPRNHTWLVQTPQAFRYELIMEAHRRARDDNLLATDDTTLVEYLGGRVKIVMGSYKNIKITTPEDLDMAMAIIKAVGEEDL